MKTIRKIVTYFAVLPLLVGMTSCLEKFPELSISEDDAMRTYNDAEQHFRGVYASLLSSSLFSGVLTLLPDIQSDMVYAVESSAGTYVNFWQWDILSNDTYVEAIYAALYSTIGNCNFYLDRINEVKAQETDDDKLENLDNYTGQIYAIRALCYSKLLECFCKPYQTGNVDGQSSTLDEPGVVLRTKYFEKEPVRRASLKASYDFVVEDLTRAEQLLEDFEDNDAPNNDYISLAAVQALRARVALYMQDWDTAITYSSKLIDDRKDIFQLASTSRTAADGADEFSYMWAYDQGPEVIWRIGFTYTNYGGALGSVFLGLNRDYQYFYPVFVPGQNVLDAYQAADGRYSSYFASTSSGIVIGYANGLEWPLLVKYYGNRSLIQYNPTQFVQCSMPKPLRLAEQYLIRAEAYCRKNEISRANQDLSALRAARGGTITLGSDWLQTISDERLRELYMEGFRLHDLKRWHRGFERTPQTCSMSEGSSLKIAADNPLFVWPIPQHEIEAPGSEIVPNDSNR